MAEVTDTLLSKKIEDSYSYNERLNNFAEEKELTVTITLNEYRTLVSEVATKKADILKANDNKYSRENENLKLKEKVEKLDRLLFEYKKVFGELPKEEDEE